MIAAVSIAKPVAASTIEMLRSHSLASAAQQEIERMILDGEISAGAKLTEAWLSERLGISRGPIREAFRMLEEAGLLRQEKNRGVFVREIALEEAVEIYDLRAAMDEMAGRKLASKIAPDQLRELKSLVEKMAQASKAGNADIYYAMNLEFHDRVVEFGGNKKLTAVYRKLVKELALFRRRNLSDRAVMPLSVSEHRHILKAISNGDAAAAGRAMFEHVMASKERMLKGQAARTLPAKAPVRAGLKKGISNAARE